MFVRIVHTYAVVPIRFVDIAPFEQFNFSFHFSQLYALLFAPTTQLVRVDAIVFVSHPLIVKHEDGVVRDYLFAKNKNVIREPVYNFN